jgi:malate synthase
VWQWARHGARLDDGRTVDASLVRTLLAEEVASIRAAGGDNGRLDLAAKLFEELATSPELADFLTLPAYESILDLS